MADNEILKVYKDEIEMQLHEAFPDYNISVFRDLEENFELPAIVINKPVLEPVELSYQKTANYKMTLSSSAFIIHSAADEDNDIECIQQAADISKFINMKTFGQRTPALVTLLEPVTEEGLEEFFIYRIDFEQKFEF